MESYLSHLNIEPFVEYNENVTRAISYNYLLQTSPQKIFECVGPERLIVDLKYKPLNILCAQSSLISLNYSRIRILYILTILVIIYIFIVNGFQYKIGK